MDPRREGRSALRVVTCTPGDPADARDSVGPPGRRTVMRRCMSTENEELVPNIPLLRKAVEWVEFQETLPEIDREWDQESYHQTPYQYAMTMLVGQLPPGMLGTVTRIQQLARRVAPHCNTTYCVAGYIGAMVDPRYVHRDMVNGVHVSQVAGQALGLDVLQSHLLF